MKIPQKCFIAVFIAAAIVLIFLVYCSNPSLELPPQPLERILESTDDLVEKVPPEGYVYDDECHCRLLPNIEVHNTSTCGLLSTVRGKEQRLISYSFFIGNGQQSEQKDLCDLTSAKNRYLAGVKKNLEGVRSLYPGYAMRVYHDAPITNKRCKIRDELCNLFCQEDGTMDLCNVRNIASQPSLEKSFGMMWRFAPMADECVLEWHSRDLDAIMLMREVDAVLEWKNTTLGFHIMRDHPWHVKDILGGMFGALQDTKERKTARSSEFSEMIKQYGSQWKRDVDQTALSKIVGPHAVKDSLIHDSYLCKSNFIKGVINVPWPTQRLSGPNFTLPEIPNFVGNTGAYASAFECPMDCRPQDHRDWKLC